MRRDTSDLARGYTIAMISAAVLSTTAILIRYLTQNYQLPPLVLAFWRDGLVACTLLPVLGAIRPTLLRVNRQQFLFLVIYGLMLATFNSLWTTAVALSGAAIATVLVYSSGGFTALLGRWLLRERLDGTKLAVVGLTMGGCVLVSEAFDATTWNANLVGVITGVLSGLWYAIYTLMGRSASERGLNPWTTLFYTFGLAALFLLALNVLSRGLVPGTAMHLSDLFWLGNAIMGWGVLFLLAAGPTVLGFGLYNVSLVYLPSSVANLIATLEPVFTTVIAFFLLGERLNGVQIFGGLMILVGVLFLRIHEGWLANQAAIKLPVKVGLDGMG